jgi:CRISPR system Cascade subunit CasB
MTEKKLRTPAAHVPSIAAVIKSEHFATGERAALKRMALDGTAPLALHRFMLRHIDEPWQGKRWLPEWRSLICSLAIQRDGGFDPGYPMGKALAKARFSETRLERLLSAKGDTLRRLALRAARQLAAAGIAADWRQFADLLFSRKPEIREAINRRIARDYFRELQNQKRKE